MKITIKNLGAIKQAEFTLGELTIICGENNTGKTYATHATYGFLDFLRTNAEFPVSSDAVEKLYAEGVIQLPLHPYIENLQNNFNSSSIAFSKMLYKVFSGDEAHFNESSLSFDMDYGDRKLNNKHRFIFGTANNGILGISTIPDMNSLEVTLIVEKSDKELPPKHFVVDMIQKGIRTILLESIIPKPFLASAERTGAAIFQKELDFTRNRLIEILGDSNSNFNLFQLLKNFSGEYSIAVRNEVDFVRSIWNIANKESFILKHHHDLLESFKDIIGGEYKVSQHGGLKFYPTSNDGMILSLMEGSSAVRSLLDIGFYLRHVAAPGDLLMVDEPELNLHPENQRRIARLFARLVNIGIKVFITTHSDYIIKELNTLIMLNQDKERLKKLAERENYIDSEKLDHDKVKMYIAEEQTLTQAEIDQIYGMNARSFDKTIEDMNRIQEEIIWGEE
ncbi:MAG: AAA family ATPase [Magnetococcales bacterium]|nr:AAA family ATPase [Magnetococcales bacterium]MBF0114162.1 AAA family ATPase [Magnetococcales bacterium]